MEKELILAVVNNDISYLEQLHFHSIEHTEVLSGKMMYSLKYCDLTFCDNMLIKIAIYLNSNLDIIKYLIHNINLDSKAHFQTILDSINNNSRDITLYLIETYNNLFINKYTKRTVHNINQTSDIKCELYNEYNAKVHEFLFENFKFSQEEFTKILESNRNPMKYIDYKPFIKNGIVLNNKLKTKILSNALIMEDISVIKYLMNEHALFDMITRDELIEKCKKQWYTNIYNDMYYGRSRKIDINSDCDSDSENENSNCNCFKCSSSIYHYLKQLE